MALGGLPRRDLWLLPLISVSTMVVVLIGAEVAARAIWPKQLFNTCRLYDPAIGTHYRPNCATTMKAPEGPWYVASYNDCGYRSDSPCGPLPPGGRRIALLGTSLAEGYLVEYPNTIAAGLESDMTRLCGAPVDVQNLGTLAPFDGQILSRMDEALRLRPQAIVMVLSPYDIEHADLERPAEDSEVPPPPKDLKARIMQSIRESRAVTMAQHFLFLDPSVYLALYMRHGDDSDYLRSPLPAKWQHQLNVLDRLIAALAARAQHADVPLTVAFIPAKPQAALMGAGRAAASGVHPMALQKAIAPIATRHGIDFIDTSVALRARSAPERLYYQVDGHLSGDGQPIAAAYIAQQLSSAHEGPFARCHGMMASIGRTH